MCGGNNQRTLRLEFRTFTDMDTGIHAPSRGTYDTFTCETLIPGEGLSALEGGLDRETKALNIKMTTAEGRSFPLRAMLAE